MLAPVRFRTRQPPPPNPYQTIRGGGGWERQTPDHICVFVGMIAHAHMKSEREREIYIYVYLFIYMYIHTYIYIYIDGWIDS